MSEFNHHHAVLIEGTILPSLEYPHHSCVVHSRSINLCGMDKHNLGHAASHVYAWAEAEKQSAWG